MAAEFLAEHPAIPGYVPVRLLGRNGAIIYLARQVSSGKLVALKVARGQFGENLRTHYAPFLHLDHPNIIRVFEIGEVKGCAYGAMEYVDGRTLADRLREGPLPVPLAVLLTRTLALTLGYVRNQRMIHLHLTPASILFTEDNVLKLFDLQVTSVVEQWSSQKRTVGIEPAFSAPEYLACESIDSGAADVYRVGAIMYAMLTGQPPFVGDIREIVAAVLEQPPAPPRHLNASLSKEVEAVCLKCLEKWPERRYASLPDLADALRRL
jgi:serine/threonine protein kinase